MPLFVIHALDKPGALETRLAARPTHLEHLAAAAGLKLAAPMLDEKGDPVGSLLIVEAADLTEVRDFFDRDPYVRAGVFDRVDIRPIRVTIGAL